MGCSAGYWLFVGGVVTYVLRLYDLCWRLGFRFGGLVLDYGLDL